MRILQLSTNFRIGGIQRHILDLSEYLRSRGHGVVLGGGEGEWRPENDDPPFELLDFDGVAAEGGSVFSRVARLLPVARRMRRILRRHRIQIIHAHETAPVIVARLAAARSGIPIVFTYHGSDPEREASVAHTARRCAALTVSPSRTALRKLVAHGLPEERTRVIGLGVHRPGPIPPERVARVRQKLLRGLPGSGEGGILVSSLSRLDQQKGIDIMIEVARKIAAQREDVRFVVAGGGPLDGLVQRWADVLGVSDHVSFLGHVGDIPALLAASDIYLLTSRWEALPISIVEAFQQGLPVVATDCGGVRELVDPAVGAVVPVGDSAAIARALLRLIEDEGLRRKQGQNALALSRSRRFSPDAVHAGFEALYRDMLG